MDSETYKFYVAIDCWKIRRENYLSMHSWCEVCGITPRKEDELYEGLTLDVHHLTYEHLGNELDEDLVSLCRLCHSGFHGLAIDSYKVLMLDTLRAANALLELPKRSLMIEKLQ